MLAREGKRPDQDTKRDLITIEVAVEPVLDLTDAAIRARYGIRLTALTSDAADDLKTCGVIADLARSEGYRAILSPSAALHDAVNLNIYVEGPASRLSLRKGGERIALNY